MRGGHNTVSISPGRPLSHPARDHCVRRGTDFGQEESGRSEIWTTTRAERLAGTGQALLPGHLVQRPGPHPGRQRRRRARAGGCAACGKGIIGKSGRPVILPPARSRT
uniref:Uncharacterized protein n=1 Tax=uncultured Armatimonadetes bacterium TaxID=157466 RepID=A0A6J4HND9_9BACT|nr:hypothetical protein AVDCRST_MAG63-966 [uncultured Armatimonadetes bacterium]